VTKPGLFNILVYVIVFCVSDAWLFCILVNLVTHIGLGLLCTFMVIFASF